MYALHIFRHNPRGTETYVMSANARRREMTADYPSSDISHLPELVRLAEQVRVTRQPRVLRHDTEELAILMPPPKRRTQAEPAVMTLAEYRRRYGSGVTATGIREGLQLAMDL